MALVKLEEAKQHVAHLEQKTALYQAILEHRSPDTTNPLFFRLREIKRSAL